MPDEPAQQAEKRGYSRGYAAGLRRKSRNHQADTAVKKRQAFWERAFLAALPTCIDVQGWARGEAPINSLKERTKLAKEFADEATRLAFGR